AGAPEAYEQGSSSFLLSRGSGGCRRLKNGESYCISSQRIKRKVSREKLCYDREIRHLASATSAFTMASQDELIISGARQNNLKNISLRIPHDQGTVITGGSRSGESSLRFDTI